MKTNQPAGFALRFLAALNDCYLWLLQFSAVAIIVSQSKDLETLIKSLLLLLAFVIFPLAFVGFFYQALFTKWFGGSVGKLLTGLRVTDEAGNNLSLKKGLFRYLIGYQFSALLFGLGFWAIIKDKNKQAWHDKASDSRVWVVRPLWPLALVSLIALLVLHYALISSAIHNFSKGELLYQIQHLQTIP